MQAGYLGVVTNAEFPDRVKIVSWSEYPQNKHNNFGEKIRYISKFNDILAAKLHSENALRRQLIDIEHHLYQTEISHAIAAIESDDDLYHEKIWIDENLEAEILSSIQAITENNRSRKKRINFFITLFAYAILGLAAFSIISKIL